MADQKFPLSSKVIVTGFGDAKAVLTVPDRATGIQVIATGIDVWVALRDTNGNTTTDDQNSVNLDTNPQDSAVCAVSTGGIPLDLVVRAGKQTATSGPVDVYPPTRRRLGGFLHYKPNATAGTGKLYVNFFK